ncbi:MAG TPA: type IV pilus secretin PilQ [Polyangia bacterium]|nr:type IV pilus secretin PilQ [Polyangia bacterium]
MKIQRSLAALLLVAATSTVWAADKAGRVWGIKVSESDGDTAITIAASAKPTFTTWKLERPARVIIDISGARLGDLEVPFDAGTYAVGSVAASTSDDDSGARTRVVLTLRQPADYRVESHGNDIVVRVQPHTRPLMVSKPNHDAESRKLAEERARTEESRKKSEAARLQAQSEQQKAETAKQQAATAQAEAQAAHKQLAEERVKIEEARRQSQVAEQQALSAQQKAQQAEREKAQAAVKATMSAEVAAERLAQERADLEARRRQAEDATRAAETARKALASAQAESEKARRDAEQAQRAAKSEREKAEASLREAVAAQKKIEDRTRSADKASAEKAREQLEAARRETERARAVAAKAAEEMDRARQEKAALEVVRSDVEKQRQALVRSESELKKTQREAEESRKRAETAERQAELARAREEERGSAVKAAAAQVEARRKALESKFASQEEQRQELARAERLVSERDAKVKAASSELAAREKAVASALARQAALEKAGASEEARKTAASEAARAAKERQEAVAAAARSRKDLNEAVDARRKEEGRKAQLESERAEEERRLKEAVAARTTEEARRQSAEEGRRQEEARLSELRATRAKAEAERAKLESDRDSLVAELDRLKRAPAPVAVAKAPAPVAAKAPALVAVPAPAPVVAPAAVKVPAKPTLASVAAVPVKVAEPVAQPPRPRSITLRVPSRVQRVDFVDEPTRSSVIIDLDEPSNFAIERTAGHKVTLRLLHADLPRGLERSMDATEYLGPVKVISTYRDPDGSGAVRVDVDLAEEVPNKVRQAGSRLYWDFQKQIVNIGHTARGKFSAGYTLSPSFLITAQAAQALGAPTGGGNTFRPGGAAKKRYTGRRVDLDFKGADIHNILRLLSDVGQVNIVVADDVKGDVTIKMRDVPWDQALDVVLRGKQLGSVREGNLIRVAPLSVLEKELEQEIARQKQITDVLPTETRLIGVSYADAKNLQDRAKDLLSSRGKISVDDRTNNLIVSDVAKNLALIEELVRNLDTQTSQVVIEARIVEARSTFVRQMGVQWGGTGFADADHGNPTGLAFPYNIGVGGGATDGQTPTGGLVPNPRNGLATANPNFAVNLPVAAGTGAGGALGLTLGSVAGAFNLNLRLSALESSGQVRILSSPRITTMDNIEASIQQGVAIPISVVSAQGVQTVFVDAILDLTVKPHVTNEGTVMLNINIRRNEPDFVNTGARGDPTILKKEAKTSMLIRDGDTAVIGGIYTRNSGLNYAKVPLFADIPILGVMFRNRRENDDRTEFLVFITPRIANRARALGQ